MLVIVGYGLVLGAVLGGFLMAGGKLAVLAQPTEFITILGAGAGAFLVSNSPQVLSATLKAIPGALSSSRYTKDLYAELLVLMYDIFTMVRREGALALEKHIETPAKSELFKQAPGVLADEHAMEFITGYLRLIAGGQMDPHQMEALMDEDIETHHQEVLVPSQALQRVADAMPAFGIVAAVMGVVHTMQSVDQPPEILGELIAAALVGTFLGILVAYGFVGPLATLLEQRTQNDAKFLQCIKACVLATLNGCDPTTAVEFGRKILYSADRPTFQEMDKHIKSKKKK